MDYHVDVLWDGETGGSVRCDKCDELRIDMPEDFEGHGRSPCPDQLFLASIGGCLLTTFIHFANRFQLGIGDLGISVEGEVSLIEGVGYRIRSVEVKVRVEADTEEVEVAEKCAELARDYCHITKSIENAIPVDVAIEVSSTHADSL